MTVNNIYQLPLTKLPKTYSKDDLKLQATFSYVSPIRSKVFNLYLYIYNASFSKTHMSSIQASIFRPSAPKSCVVVHYVEEMVNSKVRKILRIIYL